MEPRELRKERRREQVREDILVATRAVLLNRGLAGLTLAAVARQVQLTKAALYYYFPSKEALVFELVYLSLEAHARAVAVAVEATDSGAAALEALVRTSSEHYAARIDELRLVYLVPQVAGAGNAPFNAEQLERIRPFNDQMYGAVGARIQRDQQAGRVAAEIDGRRLAFLAHMAVIGMLTMEGLVEKADDLPLIHPRSEMVGELVATFRARLA